jgi:hypothetical protein
MGFDYPTTRPWVRLGERGPMHEQIVEILVHVDAVICRARRAVCVRETGKKITHWLDPDTRRPLGGFESVSHWRKV